MNAKDFFTQDEIALIKVVCRIFRATGIIIDGVKYAPPKEKE